MARAMTDRWRNLDARWRIGFPVIIAWPLVFCGLLLVSTATAGFSSFHDPIRNLSRYPAGTAIVLVVGPVMALVFHRVFGPMREFWRNRILYSRQVRDPVLAQRSVALVLDRLGYRWSVRMNVQVIRIPAIIAHAIFEMPEHRLEIVISGLIPFLSIGGLGPENSAAVGILKTELEKALG